MLWRHLCLARAITAAGLLTCSTLGALAAGEPEEPVPGTETKTETVKVLDAEKAGTLAVEVRGQGQDRVRVTLSNTSDKRLNVVMPPGLVASSAIGQGAGGGGGGGGFQSMGLGTVTNRSGGFGQFAANNNQPGFRSVPADDASVKPAVTVPAGQKVVLEIPSVCLNFGLPTPTLRDRFRLVDVDEYSKDVRVRKALRALANLGTSQGTAQAVMWRVCNNVPFEVMVEQGNQVVNPAEVALASRFLDALDQSADSVDPAYLTEARMFVTVEGDGLLAKDAKRLAAAIEGLRILGLPARVTMQGEAPRRSPRPSTSASACSRDKTARPVAESSSRLQPASASPNDWATLGQVSFRETSAASALDAASLARVLDHAVGSGFVTAKVARRSTGSTTLKIEQSTALHAWRAFTLKAGNSSGAPLLTLPALGSARAGAGLVTIPAANGSVDRVELNGL